jgi:hypothetical protein
MPKATKKRDSSAVRLPELNNDIEIVTTVSLPKGGKTNKKALKKTEKAPLKRKSPAKNKTLSLFRRASETMKNVKRCYKRL